MGEQRKNAYSKIRILRIQQRRQIGFNYGFLIWKMPTKNLYLKCLPMKYLINNEGILEYNFHHSRIDYWKVVALESRQFNYLENNQKSPTFLLFKEENVTIELNH